MIIGLTAVSILLLLIVLIQPSKGESLGTAFNGGVTHVTKVEKVLTNITFLLYFIIIVILGYLKYFN